MRALLLGHVSSAGLLDSHPLQLLFRVAHSLESLLDPFRGVSAGLVPEATIQIALESCDAIRTLLGSLTHNGAGGPVSPELLGASRRPRTASRLRSKIPWTGGKPRFAIRRHSASR